MQRILKRLNIRSTVVRKFKPFSSKIKIENRTSILKQDFSTTKLNEKSVGDITYIHTIKDGWCYLASVIDLHSRKIIGYSFSKTMDSTVSIATLNNAYYSQMPTDSDIFHSDLGTQYTSSEFLSVAKRYEMQISNSRKGCPYHNACIESFHSILKKERVNTVNYYDYKSAKLALFVFIESWYNRKRVHGSIAYITPQMKEPLARKSS